MKARLQEHVILLNIQQVLHHEIIPRVRSSLLRSAVKSSEASDSEQSEEMNGGARHHNRLPETFGYTGKDPSHTAEQSTGGT